MLPAAETSCSTAAVYVPELKRIFEDPVSNKEQYLSIKQRAGSKQLSVSVRVLPGAESSCSTAAVYFPELKRNFHQLGVPVIFSVSTVKL